jgi:polyhydroxyalkanoate synthesis regulator phasin
MSEELVFDDITLIEVPVRIARIDYVLREASGEAAIKYQNAVGKCSRFVNGEFSGVQGDLASTQSLLVSLCLFKKATPESGLAKDTPVPESLIRSWPSRIQKTLYDRAKQISMLDESESIQDLEKQIAKLQKKLSSLRSGDNLKNLSSGTTDGTD